MKVLQRVNLAAVDEPGIAIECRLFLKGLLQQVIETTAVRGSYVLQGFQGLGQSLGEIALAGSRNAIALRRAGNKKPCPRQGLRNGAKETRTPDPLHAMQVLYQLSYGPRRASSAQHVTELTPQTWRQTATNWPCTLTSAAGSVIGS